MDLDKDGLLGDYLLGKLPEEQAARLEMEYLSNADLREQLEAVEAELIDAYLKGELTGSERQELEAGFLASPRGRERLQFARAWMGSTSRERRFPPAMTWLRTAAVFVAVSLAATFVWMSMPRVRAPEITGGDRSSPTGPPPASPATSAPPAPTSAQSRPPEHWTDLYAGISRGTSGANEVAIDAASPDVALALNLDRDNHRAYDVVLVDTDWRQKGLRSQQTASGPSIRVRVPAALLGPGKEYTLVVSPATSPDRPIRAYVFSVKPRGR